MEFAETKLNEAIANSPQYSPETQFGEVARRGILNRLERNADLLQRARLLWVDDHPENNTSIAEMLRRFGARVDTPKTNDSALALLDGAGYDVIITDVARDNEGQGSDLKGIQLAEAVFRKYGQQVLLFTARFEPTTLPGVSADERLRMCEVVRKTVFGRTNRFDEVLHLILDILERRTL
jgi:CheY-like chemotaxis protein